MHENRIVTAHEVLGDLQLTEQVHKAHTDHNRRLREAGRPGV
jgi:hypothetical protein